MHKLSFAHRLIAVVALALLVFSLGGWWYYDTQRQHMQQAAEEELEAVAHLKLDQLAFWREQWIADAQVFALNPLFVENVQQWLDDPQPEQAESIRALFRLWQEQYQYSEIMLLDVDRHILLAQGDHTEYLHEDAVRTFEEAMSARRPMMTDLHLSPGDNVPHMGVIAPVIDTRDPEAPIVGAVLLQRVASIYLFPLIQSWPNPSETAETLIVRREGDSVLFMNELRHQAGTTLMLRFPVDDSDLPAARAVRGEQGIVQGKDYRGVDVLAFVHPVPDMPWYMIAKVDSSEVYADWTTRSALILTLYAGMLVTGGALVTVIWLRHRNTIAHDLLLAERARRESEQRYHTTLLSIGDGVIVTDSQGRVELINPVAESLTGWPWPEARGQLLDEVFTIINEETRQPVENPVHRVLKEGTIIGLANHTLLIARDGREIPIADSGAPISISEDALSGVVLVFRDQSEERAAQAALEQSEHRYRLLFENMTSGFALHELIRDAQGRATDYRFLDINPAFEALTGLSAGALVGKTLKEVLPESEWHWIDVYAPVVTTGLPAAFDRYSEALGRHFAVWAFSPAPGQFATIFSDITERKQRETEIARNEARLRSLVAIMHHEAQNTQDLLDYALEQALGLTDSRLGYIYLYHEERQEFTLNTWSREVMDECSIIDPQTCYELNKTGIWGEAVRQRRPILLNDFQAVHSLKKGYPEGHAHLDKFMTVPIIVGEQIVAVVGVANKQADYTDTDVLQLTLLMDAVWRVVDRQRAQEELRASEEKHRTLIEQASDGIFLADESGHYVDVNTAGCQLLGYSREQILGQPVGYFIESGQRIQMETETALHEFAMRRSDGSLVPVEVSARQLANGFVQGIVRDITERKQAEEAQRRHSAEITRLYDASRQLGETLDLSTICETVSAAVHEVLPCDSLVVSSYSPEDNLIRCVYMQHDGAVLDVSGFPPIPLEDEGRGTQSRVIRSRQSLHLRDYQAFQRTALTAYYVDDQGLMDRGPTPEEEVPRSALIVPLMIENQVIGVIQVLSYRLDAYTDDARRFLDALAPQIAAAMFNARLYHELEQRVIERTAQLNHAKERLEAILNSSSDVMILCQPDGIIEQVNPIFSRVFNCTAQEALSQPMIRMVIPEHVPRLQDAFAAVIAKGESQRLQITAQCKHRAAFEADLVLSPVIVADHHLLGIVGNLRDITARVHAEEQLRQMLEHEMALNEVRSRYVSMAAHDLRNPLAVVQSAISMIEHYSQRMNDDQKREKYARVHESIARMVALLDDILTMGKVESGKLTFDPALLDVPHFCQDVIAEVKQAYSSAQRIDVVVHGDCSQAMLDAKLLRHILGNLLSNAIKYSPDDQPVALSIECEPDQITFHVEDRGIGIPEADQQRLFEAFHRASNVGTTPGTGLGLAIVKQSVELHGGTIQFSSQEGVGTHVTVVIPQILLEKAGDS